MIGTQPNTISFLPWLRINKPVRVGGFTFTPFPDHNEPIPEGVSVCEIRDDIATILSGYVELKGVPRRNCVLVLDSGLPQPWNIPTSNLSEVRWAVAQLFLASFSKNEYFAQIRSYSNSSMFTVYHQSFNRPVDSIAVSSRRRDGNVMDGGYRHGEIKFTKPVYANLTEEFCQFDVDLLAALERSSGKGSALMKRLRPALSFLSLANTDSDLMTRDAEIILMVSAYEQLLAPRENGARHLANCFSELFSRFGNSTVRQALDNRPGIVVEPKYQKEQLEWHVYHKWIQEMYELRNSYAHGDTATRSWGWEPLEHLVIAALAFPLTQKILLSNENSYTLTSQDEDLCTALDGLLSQNDGAKPADERRNETRWEDVLSQTRINNCVKRACRSVDDGH